MENAVSGKHLRKKVLEMIESHWPIHPSDVCRKLKIQDNVSNISKIKYHFDKLHAEKKILTKKIDRALVAWPHLIEQSRIQEQDRTPANEANESTKSITENLIENPEQNPKSESELKQELKISNPS